MRKSILVAAMVLVSAAGAQAGQSRSLSLAGSDRAAQETKAVEPASAVDTQRAPMPARAAEATGATETSKTIDRPKYTERPPGVDMSMSRRSRMKAAASQRRAPPQMARADMRRSRHRHWSAARIVATLHRYGIYW
jgi:hypothetical protein